MRLHAIVVLALLTGVVGCDDASSPVAPTPVEVVAPPLTISGYTPVHRGRCPADSDLPFSLREHGWYWPDTCRNNHAQIVPLREWCSGPRRVEFDSCVIVVPPPPEPPPPPPPPPPPTVPPTTSSALVVTGPAAVPDDGCVTYRISGGTPPYSLTSFGGRWVTAAPCESGTPTRYTLPAPGQAVWSATGLDSGDSAQMTVTDADGTSKIFTVSVF